MKKILPFLLVVLFLSCSSEDDTNNSSTSINPPSWIQGNWYPGTDISNLDKTTGFAFKKNDFCNIIYNSQSCYSQEINAIIAGKEFAKVEEVVNDTEYKISITVIGTTVVYHFKKISSNKIEWLNHPLGDLDNIYFFKQ